jgi:SET domain
MLLSCLLNAVVRSVAVALLLPKAPDTTPSWLTSRLTEFDLRVKEFPFTTGRGLITTRERKAGEVLIQIPVEEAITVSSMLIKYPILAHAAEKSMKVKNQQLTDEQVLAVGLLLLKHDDDRYVTSLPPQHSVLQLPLQHLHKFPAVYVRLIQAYRQRCENLRASIVDVLPPDVATLVSEQDFQWAFATVRSRCVGMDGNDDPRIRTGGTGGEIRVMLPGFDLLNHKFGAQSTPSLDDNYYCIRSNDEYAANDQVFISYSDQRDNLKMIMTYGFCCPENPTQKLFFDTVELLRASGTVRPMYFTPQVLHQIDQLMDKLGMRQTLYEWENGGPGDSLKQAIQMMAELEKQFLTKPDTLFEEHLLSSLVAARRKETSKQLDFIIRSYGFSEKIWRPFHLSMRVLLEEEAKCLATNNSDLDPDGKRQT